MRYENDDRAIHDKYIMGSSHHTRSECLILEYSTVLKSYYVRSMHLVNIDGSPFDSWVAEDSIELDKQYYREINLKKLGIE